MYAAIVDAGFSELVVLAGQTLIGSWTPAPVG